MIRIKIEPASKSDVINMTARGGWKVAIYRNPADPKKDFVTVTKEPNRFHLYLEGDTVVLDRYLDAKRVDSKKFYDTGSGIDGTLCISENMQTNILYGYFRTDELQEIIEEFGLKKIEIAKEAGNKFSKTLPGIGDVPPFHTDGLYEKEESVDLTWVWHVSDATYIWDYENKILYIPQVYDHASLKKNLREIVES